MSDETTHDWEPQGRRREPLHPWNEDLMTHDWPESGPGSLSVEMLYQAFKARLMAELVADNAYAANAYHGTSDDRVHNLPLREKAHD